MSDGDLTATIQMQVGQSLAALKSVQSELKAMRSEVRNVKGESNAMQSQVAQHFDGMETKVKRTSKVVEQFKGELGASAGAIGRFASMGPVFGAAAAGAYLLSKAIDHITGSTQRAIDENRKLMEIRDKMHEAAKAGSDRQAGAAQQGLADANTVRALEFAGGPGAVKDVADKAKQYGIAESDMQQIRLKTLHATGPDGKPISAKARAGVELAAIAASKTGEMTGADAASRILGSPAMMQGLNKWGVVNSDETARRTIALGRGMDPMLAELGDGWRQIGQTSAAFWAPKKPLSPLAAEQERVNRINTESNEYKRDMAERGLAGNAAQTELEKLRDPQWEKRQQIKAQEDKIRKLQEDAAAAHSSLWNETLENSFLTHGGFRQVISSKSQDIEAEIRKEEYLKREMERRIQKVQIVNPSPRPE